MTLIKRCSFEITFSLFLFILGTLSVNKFFDGSHTLQFASKDASQALKTEAEVCDGNCDSPPSTVGFYDIWLQNYQQSPQVQRLVQIAKQNSFRKIHGKWVQKTWSTGDCLFQVSKILENAHMTQDENGNPTQLKVASPHRWYKSLQQELTNQGFLNLIDKDCPYKEKIKSAWDAPIGAVLVYKGVDESHAEIRVDDGFINDYYVDHPRTGGPENGLSGRGRTLVGVYVKLNFTEVAQ